MWEAWGKSRETLVQTQSLGPGLATAQISPSAKAPRGQDEVKRMRDGGEWRKGLTLANDSLAVTPIQIGPLNDMVLSIHPVHTTPGIVNGKAVGPEEMCISDDAASRAIHAGGLDARSVAPVCPINSTRKGEKEMERQVEEGG